MEMLLVSPYTSGIIQLGSIEMDENEFYSRDQEKRSCSERQPVTPSLFGDDSSTIALTSERGNDKPESIVPHLETKVRSNRQTLYARRVRSLLIAGLIAGITPMSIRRRSGADCREPVLFPLAGDMFDIKGIDSEP
jgi:hypothetical protein